MYCWKFTKFDTLIFFFLFLGINFGSLLESRSHLSLLLSCLSCFTSKFIFLFFQALSKQEKQERMARSPGGEQQTQVRPRFQNSADPPVIFGWGCVQILSSLEKYASSSTLGMKGMLGRFLGNSLSLPPLSFSFLIASSCSSYFCECFKPLSVMQT